jgi:hypothetical protein
VHAEKVLFTPMLVIDEHALLDVGEFLCATVSRDIVQPWIDHQAGLFVLIFVGLLCVWFLREFAESSLKLRREEIMQLGMKYVFSLNENTGT